MTGAFSPKVVAPGEGTTVKLFGVGSATRS